jgi:hypothetical protein
VHLAGKRSHALDSRASATARTPASTSNRAATPSAEHDEIRPGKPIDDFASPVELLLAIRDAVYGHRSLLVDGLVLRRDVSVNNVLITLPAVPRRDGFHGFLLDLNHAITSDALGHHSGAPESTGTFEFMSTCALCLAPAFHHG